MPTNIGKRDMEQSFRSKNIEKSGAENKTKQTLQQGSEKRGKPRIMLGIFVALFILMFFAGMALAGGIYFKVIDLAKWSQQYKLYQLPVVGKYMPQMPQTNFEPVEQQEKPVENLAQQQPQMLPPTNPIAQEQPKVNEEQKQKEAAKALSKTSRTYASMSPEQAVPILDKLDDDTVLALLSKMEDEQVAKLLGAMESQRAATLTSKMMMKKQ